MDDKTSQAGRFIFPEIGSHSDYPSQWMQDDLKTSLLHENEVQTGLIPRNEPQNNLLCRLFWGAWEQPIGKKGIIILFMSWLLMAMVSTTSLLFWIGSLGMMTGVTLLGLSMFTICLNNARTNTDQNEEGLNNGRIGPA